MSTIRRKGFVLGVTGGIACGKSEAGRILGAMGFSVCDADGVAHDLMKKGSPVFEQVVRGFGKSILSENGEISRPVLGAMVFNDAVLRVRLNETVHPAVRDYLETWISKRRGADESAAVLVPLLYESGMQNMDWDAVICVSSSEKEVIRRLEARRLSRGEAEKRIQSQWTSADKERLADHVVSNNGTLEEFEVALRKTVEAIAGEREI